MTLPDERYRALTAVRQMLFQLATRPGRITKREVRAEIRRVLKHYPTGYELEQLAKLAPELLEAPKPLKESP